MSHLSDYYRLLLSWEKQGDSELVSEWNTEEITAIKNDFIEAAQQSRIKDLPIPIVLGSTNQSIGNQVADFFVQVVNKFLRKFLITECSGKGYPDRILMDRTSRKLYPFELKA